jgi:hypothetical protein
MRSFVNFYSSLNIIRMIKSRTMRWVGNIAHTGTQNSYRVLVRKPEGGRAIGRPRHRWEDNMRMDLREIGWGGRD